MVKTVRRYLEGSGLEAAVEEDRNRTNQLRIDIGHKLQLLRPRILISQTDTEFSRDVQPVIDTATGVIVGIADAVLYSIRGRIAGELVDAKRDEKWRKRGRERDGDERTLAADLEELTTIGEFCKTAELDEKWSESRRKNEPTEESEWEDEGHEPSDSESSDSIEEEGSDGYDSDAERAARRTSQDREDEEDFTADESELASSVRRVALQFALVLERRQVVSSVPFRFLSPV
jgi:hypothetical protein